MLHAADDNALTIIDISNPSNPTFKGVIKGDGAPNYLDEPTSIFISEKYAFVTSTSDNALSIIDVSDPSNPTLKGVIKGAGSPNYLDGAK